MYRVVLIDDEAVILEGLKRVVKWENYDCQVVGTAFDAKSGNDLIRQEKPDILFTDIRDMVRALVSDHAQVSEEGRALFVPERESVGVCPRCGKPVYEGKKNFACSDRSCGFVLWKDDRFWTSRKKVLTAKMAADLLKKGRILVKGMWSEKKGVTYDATVLLDDTGEKYVHYKLDFQKKK